MFTRHGSMRFIRGFLSNREMEVRRGERISWKAVNGIRSGVVIDEWDGYYLVDLDNGKYTTVNSKSIIYEDQRQSECDSLHVAGTQDP